MNSVMRIWASVTHSAIGAVLAGAICERIMRKISCCAVVLTVSGYKYRMAHQEYTLCGMRGNCQISHGGGDDLTSTTILALGESHLLLRHRRRYKRFFGAI